MKQVATKDLKAALVRRKWLHAHEEDTKTDIVYRPVGYPFPPSRGRDGFELVKDGRCVAFGPGRDDRVTKDSGRWTLDDRRRLELVMDKTKDRPVEFQIVSVAEDRLVVRKMPRD
jgi:hypothetical protein